MPTERWGYLLEPRDRKHHWFDEVDLFLFFISNKNEITFAPMDKVWLVRGQNARFHLVKAGIEEYDDEDDRLRMDFNFFVNKIALVS